MRALNILYIIAILIVILKGSTIKVQNNDIQKHIFHLHSKQSLKNITGPGINSTLAKKIYETINKAYLYYQLDIRMNSDFINDQLYQTFSTYFSTVIFNSNETIIADIMVWTNLGVYVMWYNVNQYQPTWVYTIWKIQATVFPIYHYTDQYQIGSGISQTDFESIKNVMLQEENKHNQCLCSQLSELSDQIARKIPYNFWSIICKSVGLSYIKGYFYQSNNCYLSFNPNQKCEYLIFASHY